MVVLGSIILFMEVRNLLDYYGCLSQYWCARSRQKMVYNVLSIDVNESVLEDRAKMINKIYDPQYAPACFFGARSTHPR